VERTAVPAVTVVEAWHAELDVAPSALDACASTLADDERTRAARFVFDRDRRRFIVARGILRRILGARVGVEPGRIRFEYGGRGKPRLAGAHARVRFNVAHSHGHGLFAVSAGTDVGADIEMVRPLPDTMAIAERFFSPDERSRLRALPPPERDIAFFRCWTRKEAYIKGLGEGLAHPLDAFSVGLEPGGTVTLVDAGGSDPARSTWSLHDVSSLPTYAAAVAAWSGATPVRLTLRELRSSLDPCDEQA
jgi:4'-phosphopantetheinyl transferase